MAWAPNNYTTWNPNYNPVQPYMAPQMPVQAPQSVSGNGQGLSPASRMVSNREEANATPADFSGAMMVFPDIHNNRIYLKRWNIQTGAADFYEFAPYIPEEAKPVPVVKYATVEQLEEVMAEIEALKKPVKKVKKDDADE